MAFILSLFAPYLFFFSYFGKVVFRDLGVSGVFQLIFSQERIELKKDKMKIKRDVSKLKV